VNYVFHRTQSSFFTTYKNIVHIAILKQNSYACYVTYCELCVSTELRAAFFHHIQKHSEGIENIAILKQNSYAFYVTYCELCVSTELRAAFFYHIQKHSKGIENISIIVLLLHSK